MSAPARWGALVLGVALSVAPRVALAEDEDEDTKAERDPPKPAPKKEPADPPADPAPGLAPPRDDPAVVHEPAIAPSLVWLLAQAVPSPELVVGDEGARFGMRWQVTPFLYSFGIHRKLSPIRTLVVEPIVRHSGSVELFVSPEWVGYKGGTALVDVGVRTTVPLLHRGEYLSVSAGVARTSFDGHVGVRYEGGVYVLFGLLGAVVSVSPTPALSPVATTLTLRVRYF